MVIAIVGSGGKTSLLKKLAAEYKAQGKKVFLCTSTHMKIEPETLMSADLPVLLNELEEKGYVMAGLPVDDGMKKLSALPEEVYTELCKHADVTLVEADGSRHLPIKFPNSTEPVIPQNCDKIMVVCGLHALGKPLSEVAHRPELVKSCLKASDDTIITAKHIQTLVQKGYLEPLREKYPHMEVSVQPALGVCEGTIYQRAIARLLHDEEDVSLLKEDWFAEQPELFVCGAGHVATELVKMAALLDFKITVMDDRADFADPARLPMAAEVICDSFDKLSQYIKNRKNAYYVVLTRGHRSDYDCVKTLMAADYHYLGMIGSRRKVASTIDKLRSDGFSDKELATLHAPIGLPIKAQTPAEIAVSILAEMILCKNSLNPSFASKELLSQQGKGCLCVIIGKHGSAPRGEGSMMFVGKDFIVDSVGGGAVENAAIADARACDHVMIKDYDLSVDNIADLGMICGGSNRILFIPLDSLKGAE